MSAKVEAAGGRSLSKSVSVGLILGAAFLLSVLISKEVFVLLSAVTAAVGAWELSGALRLKGWYVPRLPLIIGSLAIMPVSFIYGPYGQWLTAFSLVALLIVWRLIHLVFEAKKSRRGFVKAILDFAASAFIVIYVPLMTSFGMLLLRKPDGQYWVLTYVVTVAMIDTMGYLIGRRLGRLRIAPGVSPKKSLEGLIASIVAGVATSLFLTIWLIGDAKFLPAWGAGLVLAGAILLAAVFGDLGESLIKRDLGVKDMSSILPGHGGIMDRLDSILPATLVAYLVSVIFF